MELLLLSELGTSYTSHLLDFAIQLAGQNNSANISPMELHHFISSNNGEFNANTARRYQTRLWGVTNTLFSLSYILCCFFFAAAVVNLFKWSRHYKADDDKDGALSDAEFLSASGFDKIPYWLYNVGTLGFSEMAYEVIRDLAVEKQRAKALLQSCIRYSQYYNQDDPVWQNYNEQHYLDAKSIYHLLEEADVLLTESEANDLAMEIDKDGNGKIEQEEFEAYFDDIKSSNIALCLKDFNFMSNLTWFIGAVGYTFYAYYDKKIGDIIGAIGYFCGGVAYCAMFYSSSRRNFNTQLKLKNATNSLIRTYSRRYDEVRRTGGRNTLLFHTGNMLAEKPQGQIIEKGESTRKRRQTVLRAVARHTVNQSYHRVALGADGRPSSIRGERFSFIEGDPEAQPVGEASTVVDIHKRLHDALIEQFLADARVKELQAKLAEL